MASKPLRVGVVGGGLGGLTAAISIARAGAAVTVLEAAAQLGEIGAGIQMFGNVSRFLVRCGIDEIIGDNLVAMDEVRSWDGLSQEGRIIGREYTRSVAKMQGFPWWVIRRDHLHAGLVGGAERDGVAVRTGFRVGGLEDDANGVTVISENGDREKFDLVIGADGLRSYMRNHLFPELKPQPVNKMAAYRAVVSYEEVFTKIPEARLRIGNTMDLFVGPGGYVLLYPLTAGKELNVVAAFEQPQAVTELEEVDVKEFRDHCSGWDPLILKILGLVKETKRWPLLALPRIDTWSNKHKNIVLMGDAIHGMQNHMAQGAATSMEDGIFLGRVISEVVRSTITVAEAIHLYELKRKPRVFTKQQSSFVQGELYAVRGDTKTLRDAASSLEARLWEKSPVHPPELPPTYRTWLMYASPLTVPGILYYDAEGDADFAVCEYLQNKGDVDPKTLVSSGLRAKWRSAMDDNGMGRFPVRAQKRSSKL